MNLEKKTAPTPDNEAGANEKGAADRSGARQDSVRVTIMQRQFTVACSAAESPGVVAAAAYLDAQMRAVSTGGQVLAMDRCAIMAGLNISHELLDYRGAASEQKKIQRRLENLRQQVDEVVENIRQAAP